MSRGEKPNRRDFIIKSAGIAGGASALMSVAPVAQGQSLGPQLPELEPGFKLLGEALDNNWGKYLGAVAEIDYAVDAKELDRPEVQERHTIYCYLLMKLIQRFWNGNKNGPNGIYPDRRAQLADSKANPDQPALYLGDRNEREDRSHIRWDRYLGHNIACVAVDGNGHIIDFDFNHNAFFRSTAEHAESRMVRRLFSLTDVFDNWKTGGKISDPHPAILSDVTLYTSLESCAQCSGVMSLAGVKQIIYLQNDFTAYKVGNFMYNLAKHRDGSGKMLPGAPLPIPATKVGLGGEFEKLNKGNIDFAKRMKGGNEFFFKSRDGKFVDRDPSITSYLCTDHAYSIFEAGGNKLDSLALQHESFQFVTPPPKDRDAILSNKECLAQANKFYAYADTEGYRGSPHKL
jgi:tRNA(Arg) A34 adenosine deaminase TadA